MLLVRPVAVDRRVDYILSRQWWKIGEYLSAKSGESGFVFVSARSPGWVLETLLF